jgi:hypothetical protein
MYLNAKATAAFNGEDYCSASVHETLTGSTINSFTFDKRDHHNNTSQKV